MIKRVHKLFICCLVLILLSGCWDGISIEERGFIIGMAIDVAKDGNKNGSNDELTLTSQIAVPAGLGTPSGGGGGGQKGYMNISASGISIYDIAQDVANQTNKMPFFEHLKVIIVSEEVASIPELFANVMDVFIRNRDTHRGIYVVISKGKAMDILDIQPENEQLPARYIDKILENSLRKTGEMKPVRIGDIHEYLLTESSFVLSEVAAKNNRINFEGGSVFKGDSSKVIGSLSLEEMLGYELITGQEVRGPVVVDFKGHLTAYSIREANSKIKIKAKDPKNIEIDVIIKLEGEMQETFGTVKLQKTSEVEALEKAVSDKVKEIANKSIEQAQKELKADVFGFGDNLKKFHYETWEQMKDNWDKGDNYFSNSTVNVTVKTEVRSDGVIYKSKE
ncbi:Ger(x)C family spore germination protein [Ornithinibacillus californiensis]|uniref:Ger(x)C family spore germination protein n=1 Tax=Ornithinibacillus californiensis TaxID=161536 RepID=UPI00064E093A|nr:Ger(x)C family spore germination protein [Ornithinibacillus californiensis]